jgi:hypothetical protein
MTIQPKKTKSKVSQRDREFEQLLRRAARYTKAQGAGNLRLARQKRSDAA